MHLGPIRWGADLGFTALEFPQTGYSSAGYITVPPSPAMIAVSEFFHLQDRAPEQTRRLTEMPMSSQRTRLAHQ